MIEFVVSLCKKLSSLLQIFFLFFIFLKFYEEVFLVPPPVNEKVSAVTSLVYVEVFAVPLPVYEEFSAVPLLFMRKLLLSLPQFMRRYPIPLPLLSESDLL
jgi:hypothetical protein